MSLYVFKRHQTFLRIINVIATKTIVIKRQILLGNKILSSTFKGNVINNVTGGRRPNWP